MGIQKKEAEREIERERERERQSDLGQMYGLALVSRFTTKIQCLMTWQLNPSPLLLSKDVFGPINAFYFSVKLGAPGLLNALDLCTPPKLQTTASESRTAKTAAGFRHNS